MELIKVKREDILECPYCHNLLSVRKSEKVESAEVEKPKKKYTKHKKARKEFSDNEGQQIIEMRSQGKPFSEIARALGRSLPTVYAKFKKQMSKQNENLATDVTVENI